jgi:type IV fimbrial biogenesis protein FimT
MNTARQHGFNLLELMVGITVLGVMLGLGIPSFNQMIRTNRLAEQSNELVAAFNYARSEALKQGVRVSVCPGSGGACSGAGNWNAGILVFTDDTGTTGALDAGDVLVQSWPPVTNGFISGGPTAFTFSPSGALAAGQIDVYKSGCSGPQARRISVAATGRIGLTKVACP